MNLHITTTDFVLILAYLAAVVAFGIWIGRGQRSVQDYFLGSRNLPWWAILGSIVATETSTATFLSVPALAYKLGGDLRFLQLALGYIVGRVLIVMLFMPGLFRQEILTVYQLLELRFGSATKRICSLLFLVTRNLGDGLRLFLAAIALRAIAETDLATAVLFVGTLTIIYTFAGGMKSVVWNDCLQLVVYTVGGAVALGVLINKLPGGFEQVLEFGRANSKLRMFDFRLDFSEAYCFWSAFIGGAVLTLGTHATDQMMVQRYLCARSQRGASAAVMASGFVVFVQFALFLALGVALACFYNHPPDAPFENAGDKVLATFIVQELPVGLVGLCLAAVFAAAMSTLSSSLNSSAAAAYNDLLLPVLNPQSTTERKELRWSRGLTVLFGVIQMAVAIGAAQVDRTVVNSALAIAGFSAGILLGVFGLGLLPKQFEEFSVIAGISAGLVAVTTVWLTELTAWPWFAVIGATTTIVVALLIQKLAEASGRTRSSTPPGNPAED